MKIKMHYLINLRSLIKFVSIFSTIIFLTFQLAGCATAGKGTLPRGGDMTMAQIYQKETGLSMNNNYEASDTENSGTGDQNVKQVRQKLRTDGINCNRRIDYAAYSVPSNIYFSNKKAKRTKNSTKQLFKPLDNPEVPMYVYPHLVETSSGAQPVPGYTTAFFLYRENHFAMPSEEY